MACEECAAARLYPGHRRFELKCLWCGARLIQSIKRLESPTKEERSARCKAVLADWLKYGHSEEEIRALADAKEPALETADAPAVPVGKRCKT
jgi:hypothetical protein